MRTGRTLRLLACLLALICMMGCVSVASADHASDCKQGKHVMGPWEVWEYPGATCGDYVLRTRHCKYCRYTEDEDYLLQHNWSEWTVETPPKDGNPGILKRYCKRCGKVEYKYYYDETPEKKLDLAVEIISPPKAEYHVGDDIEIAITLTNRGSVTLTSPWAGFYSGNRGVITVLTRTAVVLEPNESAHFGPEQGVHYTYTVDEYDVKNGKIEFTAYGSAYDPNGEQVDSNEETFEFPAGFTAKLGLSVQVLNPKAYYDENDVISFALIPRNESDITLYDPAVCMVFDSGRVDASWTGFVAPTDVVIFDENSGSPFEYTVTASDVSKGTVILKFSARAFIDSDTSPDGYAVYSETVELEYPTTAKYASIFLKVEGDEYTPLHEGEQTVLTITVTNTGTVPVEKTLIYHTIANADIWDPSQLDGMLLPDMSISGSYTLTVAPGDVTEAKRDFVARSRYGLPDEEDNYPLVWSNNATFEVPVERPGMDKVPVLDVKEYFRGRPENHSGDPVDFYWSVTNEGPEEYKIVSVECSVDGGADTDIAYFYPAKEMTPNGGYETGKWTEPLPLTFGSNIIATYKFYALVEDSSGELKVTNTVNIPVSVIDTIFDPVPSTLVAVDKIEKSHSTDPLGYVSGEKVIYLIKVTNVCSETLYDIEVTDPLKGENEDAVIDVIPKLEPNEYKELTFEYTVTDMDCAHGQILNQATASWIDPATEKRISIQSLEVKVDTLKGFTPSVIKYDAGVPDMHIDGAYYIPGDIIHFVIEIENHTGFTFTEVKVYDPLQPDKYLAEYEELKPGEHKTIDFYYTVKDSDCIPPYLYNQAVVFFLISGDRSRASSDEVSVPVGIPKEVVVTKKETSVPDNAAYLAPEDAYYTEGEVIVYSLSIFNGTDVPIHKLELWDVLQDPMVTPFFTLETLNPGETVNVPYPFTHVVDKTDIGNKVVVNWAWLNYRVVSTLINARYLQATSNTVISPCDKNPPPPTPPRTPTGLDCCERELISDGDGEIVYRLHHCDEHLDVQVDLDSALALAVTDEDKLTAYAAAREGWFAYIDDMYDRFMATASVAEKQIIMQEKAQFFRFIAVYEAELTTLYPDDPVMVQKEINTILENRLADLCLEYNRPGMTRKDCPDTLLSSGEEAVPGEKCAVRIEPIQDTNVFTMITLCQTHSGVFDDTRSAWMQQLNLLVSKRYSAAAEEDRALISTSRSAFGEWMKAREAFLRMIYPYGATVDKVVMQTVRYFAVTECAK